MICTGSCVKITKEYYMKHDIGLWFMSTEYYDGHSTYKSPFHMAKTSPNRISTNTLYIYSATNGTYTIKDDPTFDDESYRNGYIHDLKIKMFPADGKLEEGMVFSIEDGNLEMTAIRSTYEEDYNQKATTGKLMIDRIYKDNSVQGRFEFTEEGLWEYSEGVFILKSRIEE